MPLDLLPVIAMTLLSLQLSSLLPCQLGCDRDNGSKAASEAKGINAPIDSGNFLKALFISAASQTMCLSEGSSPHHKVADRTHIGCVFKAPWLTGGKGARTVRFRKLSKSALRRR